MKKLGLLVLSVTLLMSGVTVAAEKQTLNYWSRSQGPDDLIKIKMIDEFNRTHPGIEVKVQFMTWGGSYYGKTRSAILAGNPPELFDVAAYAPLLFKGNVETFSAEELEQEMGIKLSEHVASAWDVLRIEGRYYGTVLSVLPMALYYNKDMFKEAGLDPEKPPRNLKEFVEYGKKLTKDKDGDGTIDQWGFVVGKTLNPNFWIWESILVQNGGFLLNDDKTKANFNNKAGLDALNLLLDFGRKDKIAPPTLADTVPLASFAAKKAAMAIGGIWQIPGFRKLKLPFGTAPLPQYGARPAAWASVDSYFFPKGMRKDAKKWKAIMTYAGWVSGPEGQDFYSRMFLPTMLKVVNGPATQDDPHFGPIAKGVGDTYFPPSTKATQKIYGIVWSSLEGALAGKLSAAEALATAEEQTNMVLAR
jgi:multiple sugar transport system substrate-binding protein